MFNYKFICIFGSVVWVLLKAVKAWRKFEGVGNDIALISVSVINIDATVLTHCRKALSFNPLGWFKITFFERNFHQIFRGRSDLDIQVFSNIRRFWSRAIANYRRMNKISCDYQSVSICIPVTLVITSMLGNRLSNLIDKKRHQKNFIRSSLQYTSEYKQENIPIIWNFFLQKL